MKFWGFPLNLMLKRNISSKVLVLGLATALIFLPACARTQPKTSRVFPIELKVDFGPAGKPAHEEKLFIEEGTTPKEAVSQVFPIRSGKSCCSFREVIEINGVAVDPLKKRWWICLVNGNKKDTSPHQTELKAGDVVEWNYIQDT